MSWLKNTACFSKLKKKSLLSTVHIVENKHWHAPTLTPPFKNGLEDFLFMVQIHVVTPTTMVSCTKDSNQPQLLWSDSSYAKEQIASLTVNQASQLSQSQPAFVSYKSWVRPSTHRIQTAELQRWCHFTFFLCFSVKTVSSLHTFFTVCMCMNIIWSERDEVLKAEIIFHAFPSVQVWCQLLTRPQV